MANLCNCCHFFGASLHPGWNATGQDAAHPPQSCFHHPLVAGFGNRLLRQAALCLSEKSWLNHPFDRVTSR